jgi:hypothetical protein
VATIPAKPPGDMVGNLGGEVLFTGLHFSLWNVEE